MTSDISIPTGTKRRRIMIITADEDIIDQIERSNDASLFTQIVLESEADNSKSMDQQVQSVRQKYKPSYDPLNCVVCGSTATGNNFGVIACESCKAFFRRNSEKNPATMQCRYQRACQITSETRRNCPACRLIKCFSSGMRRDRLLTDGQKTAKRLAIEENQTLALNSNSNSNEEQSQLSLSAISDDLLMPIDTELLFHNEFADLLSTRWPQLQTSLLSSADIERLETIPLLYQKRVELAAQDGLPWDPSRHAENYLQVLNSHSVQMMRLLSFFKRITEFDQLNVEDKVTLMKYNFFAVLGISSTLSFNTETRQLIETNTDAPCNMQFSQLVFGYSIISRAHKIYLSLLDITTYDQKITHLILIVLLLTPGFSIIAGCEEVILIDQTAIYRAHNYYTELLWKYMETTYDYEKAVHLFSKLIMNAMSWQTIHEEMRTNIMRALSPDDIDELLPIMKSMLRIQ